VFGQTDLIVVILTVVVCTIASVGKCTAGQLKQINYLFPVTDLKTTCISGTTGIMQETESRFWCVLKYLLRHDKHWLIDWPSYHASPCGSQVHLSARISRQIQEQLVKDSVQR
jgi:hypothetical protein